MAAMTTMMTDSPPVPSSIREDSDLMLLRLVWRCKPYIYDEQWKEVLVSLPISYHTSSSSSPGLPLSLHQLSGHFYNLLKEYQQENDAWLNQKPNEEKQVILQQILEEIADYEFSKDDAEDSQVILGENGDENGANSTGSHENDTDISNLEQQVIAQQQSSNQNTEPNLSSEEWEVILSDKQMGIIQKMEQVSRLRLYLEDRRKTVHGKQTMLHRIRQTRQAQQQKDGTCSSDELLSPERGKEER